MEKQIETGYSEQLVTWRSWYHPGTLALSAKRQSARMSKIIN